MKLNLFCSVLETYGKHLSPWCFGYPLKCSWYWNSFDGKHRGDEKICSLCYPRIERLLPRNQGQRQFNFLLNSRLDAGAIY